MFESIFILFSLRGYQWRQHSLRVFNFKDCPVDDTEKVCPQSFTKLFKYFFFFFFFFFCFRFFFFFLKIGPLKQEWIILSYITSKETHYFFCLVHSFISLSFFLSFFLFKTNTFIMGGSEDDIEMGDASQEKKDKGKESSSSSSSREKPKASTDSIWVEKYRPSSLDDIISHQHILSTLNRFFPSLSLSFPPSLSFSLSLPPSLFPLYPLFSLSYSPISLIEGKKLPHMLFYGPPGTGKTSTILAGPSFSFSFLSLFSFSLFFLFFPSPFFSFSLFLFSGKKFIWSKIPLFNSRTQCQVPPPFLPFPPLLLLSPSFSFFLLLSPSFSFFLLLSPSFSFFLLLSPSLLSSTHPSFSDDRGIDVVRQRIKTFAGLPPFPLSPLSPFPLSPLSPLSPFSPSFSPKEQEKFSVLE